MKVFHYINFFMIFLILISICIVEDCLVTNSLADIKNRCYYIEELIEEKNGIKNNEIVSAVENLEDKWNMYEKNVCYLVNHKLIQDLGVEVYKLKSHMYNNQIDEFKTALQSIKFYCHSYMLFAGGSIKNVL